VHDVALQSGWETFLLAAPLLGMVLVGVFRLDAIAGSPKHRADTQRPPSGIDESGHILLSDPDGRPWSPTRHPE
jgi:hypothetical protein